MHGARRDSDFMANRCKTLIKRVCVDAFAVHFEKKFTIRIQYLELMEGFNRFRWNDEIAGSCIRLGVFHYFENPFVF